MKNIIYNKMKEGFIKTEYGNIYFKHNKGKNKKIIMLHGLGKSTKSFAKLVNNMQNNIDIYLIDLLGHGNSNKPKINYSADIQINILNKFIEKIKYNDFYLLGHSYGGFIALKYLAKFGTKQIKGLILEDSVGLKEYFDLIQLEKNFIEKQVNYALKFKSNKKFVIKSVLQNLKDSGLINLSYINKPTLILWGKEDDVIKLNFAKKFKSKIKESSIKIITKAQHNPHYSHAEQVSSILLDFISKNTKSNNI